VPPLGGPGERACRRFGADEVGDAVAGLREAGHARPVEARPHLVPQRGLRLEDLPIAARIVVVSPRHTISSMDFELTDELSALQETCRRIAQDKVKPRARDIDDTEEYPQDIFEVFRDAGMLGL